MQGYNCINSNSSCTVMYECHMTLIVSFVYMNCQLNTCIEYMHTIILIALKYACMSASCRIV